jgi:hypothetical protein
LTSQRARLPNRRRTTGFFAEVDLYEVQPAPKKAKAAASEDDDDLDADLSDGDNSDDDTSGGGKASGHATGQAHDELDVGHFVTAEQLKAYKAEEIVPDPLTGKANHQWHCEPTQWLCGGGRFS